jgi:hypothetical protein
MSTEVDIEKLREFYTSFQCHGVVALIDYLASPEAEDLIEIGSGTIGLNEILKEVWLDADAHMASAWFRVKSLYIGSRDGSVTPLQWLQSLSEEFEKVSVPGRKQFDEICAGFVEMCQATPAGNVMSYTSKGTFSIPPDVYKTRRKLSDEEMEQYRVTPSKPSEDLEVSKDSFGAPFKDEPNKNT